MNQIKIAKHSWLKLLQIAGATFSLAFATLMPSIATATSASATGCSNAIYATGWVAKENAKKGDAHWQDLVLHGKTGTVSGWFDQTSVACGATVGLHLSGNNRPVTIKIYRMGYYGGTNARLVYTTTTAKVPRGSAPIVANDPTHLTSTNWPTTTTIHIDSNFPTGIYMARFDDGSKAGYAPLVVRNDTPAPGLLLVAGDITWEAYNTYGGWSLYHGPNTAIYDPGRMVSFNRPYDRDGKSNFVNYDAGIAQTAESMGVNVSYTDDVYVSTNPSSVMGHTSVIYNGHSEYWTTNMLTAATTARDSGINLIFFGANDAYWRTRLESNNRNIVVWKASPQDPYYNDPAMITNKWGEAPTPFNQSQLLGSLYAGILATPLPYTVVNANVWPIKGTGLKTGDTIAGLVGKELQSTDLGVRPAVQSLLTAKAVNLEDPSVTWNINMTYYTTTSKSGVLNVGTMGWVCNITNTCSWTNTADAKTKGQVIAITKQILSAAASGPLGVLHPAVPNIPANTTLIPICTVSIASCTAPPPDNS